MRKRTGILGGAFNPVHKGHMAIASSFLKSNLIHELYILPAPYPPHKPSLQLVPFEHRLKMLRIAFEGMENILISELESELSSPSYTLQTVKHLQQQHPDTLFYLCIGEDSLHSFENWHQYRKIIERVTLLVAGRTGYKTPEVPGEVMERTIFADHQPVEVSSSELRSSRAAKRGFWEENLPEAVSNYIIRHNLYKDNA